MLSAGHCCAGIIGSGDVVAGGIDIYLPEGVEQHKKITKFSHPDYDSGTINNDVCLLKVIIVMNSIKDFDVIIQELFIKFR